MPRSLYIVITLFLSCGASCFGPHFLTASDTFRLSTRNVEISVFNEFESSLSAKFTLFSPGSDLVTTQDRLVVRGVNRLLTPVYVNAHNVSVRRDGRFFYTLNLKRGPQVIYISYFNAEGTRISTLKRQIHRFDGDDKVSGNGNTAADLFFTLNTIPNAATRDPKGLVTRGDLAVLLMKLSSGNALLRTSTELWSPTDLDVGSALNSAVPKIVAYGLMDVYSDGQFRPMAPISRFDYVLGVVKALGLPLRSPPYNMPYKNIPSSYWPSKYIATAFHAQLIDPADRFDMGAPVTIEDLARWVANVKSIQSIYQAASVGSRDYDLDHRYFYRIVSAMFPPVADVSVSIDKPVSVAVAMVAQPFPSKAHVPVVSTSPVVEEVFTDLKGHWLEKTVRTLYSKGLLSELDSPSGRNDRTLFYPMASISRGEFARLMMSLYRIPTGNLLAVPTDLPTTNIAFHAVSAMVSANIFVPDKAGKVYPDRPLTKIEALVMIERVSGIELTTSTEINLPFKDVNSRSWAAPYLQAALDRKLISPSTFYLPLFPIRRAEVIALIAKTPQIAILMK